ncbi:MAG: 23S rRNA (pseudouridine(1915)-N(3))-methyltransferase RlmH [Rhizobiaceae bacterium]
MRVSLNVIGQMKSGPERELVDRYADRFMKIAPTLGMEFRAIAQTSESKARDTETRKREEAKALLPDNDLPSRIIAFDERGKPISSDEFAALIGKWRDEGARTLSLLIGGADGLHESIRERADRIVSFGAMTMPHQLVRVAVCEQLYRAATILSGHPYHRQ